MYGEMGSKSNTIMFNDRPADINSLFAQAALAIRGTTSAVGPDILDITNSTSNSSGSGNDTFETTEKTSLP
jgi:hypothetical protein